MNHGDICRARCGAPARYLKDGRCLYISAQDNDLGVDWAKEATGGEERLPLPSDDMLEGACAAGLTWLRKTPEVEVVRLREALAEARNDLDKHRDNYLHRTSLGL